MDFKETPLSAVCVGDNCVDFYLPPVDRKYIGGNALNTAVYLQEGGVPAAYVGVVGDDANGALTLEKLAGKGVDTSWVRVLPGETATTHILLSDSKERQFVYEYPGPQPEMVLDEAAIEFICRHTLIHNTMLGGTEAYLSIFKRSSSATISFDYGERSHPDFIARTIPCVDWAFFSTASEDVKAAQALAFEQLARGPSLVVVTMGAGGSIACDGDLYYQPAFPVPIVDTLGAGDAFIGTFLANRLRGRELSGCLQAASQVASITCTHFGGWLQTENQSISKG